MAITPESDQMVSFYVTFDSFLLDTTFHRIVVRLIEMVQDRGYTTAPKLCYNKATIDLWQDHTLTLGQVIIESKPAVKFEISRKSEASDGNSEDTNELCRNVCIQVLEHLKEELKALTSRMKRTSTTFRVLCWSGHCHFHFQNMEECLKNDYILCGKESIKTIKLQKLLKNKRDGNQVFLEDDDLLLVSERVENEWKKLGVRLGCSWNRLNQICMYNNKRQPECTLQMLTEWRSKLKYGENQVQIMADALIDEKLVDLANLLLDLQRHVKSAETIRARKVRQTQQKG